MCSVFILMSYCDMREHRGTFLRQAEPAKGLPSGRWEPRPALEFIDSTWWMASSIARPHRLFRHLSAPGFAGHSQVHGVARQSHLWPEFEGLYRGLRFPAAVHIKRCWSLSGRTAVTSRRVRRQPKQLLAWVIKLRRCQAPGELSVWTSLLRWLRAIREGAALRVLYQSTFVRTQPTVFSRHMLAHDGSFATCARLLPHVSATVPRLRYCTHARSQ